MSVFDRFLGTRSSRRREDPRRVVPVGSVGVRGTRRLVLEEADS